MKKTTTTEKELRAAWTAQRIPRKRQDEMLADIVAKAQPGAMVGPFQIGHDYGPTIGTGPTARPTNPHPESPVGRAIARQATIPGTVPASPFADMAKRRAAAPLKPKVNQRACDAGLFSDDAAQADFLS